MSTTWELMGVCIADAEKAEDLVRELAFRNELRADPDKALAAFVLWHHPARTTATPARAGRRERRVRTAPAI